MFIINLKKNLFINNLINEFKQIIINYLFLIYNKNILLNIKIFYFIINYNLKVFIYIKF